MHLNVLDHIIENKRKEVALKKQLVPSDQLEHAKLFSRTTISLANQVKNSPTGIIAEHKRRSPSKAIIHQKGNVAEITKGYEKANAAGISILTDSQYFGGSLEDLLFARASVHIPLLRKDFIVEEYQIIESKAHGADAILLIAAILDPSQQAQLADLAKTLSLDVLLEVHNREELERSILQSVDMIGINNRNLKDFTIDIRTSIELSKYIPNDFVKISESGISSLETIRELKNYAYQGFLIGEAFMKTENPVAAATDFIAKI